MIGMFVVLNTNPRDRLSGIIDAVSVMADGLAIARVCDRWVPVDELVAV